MRRNDPQRNAPLLQDVFGGLSAAELDTLLNAGEAITLEEGDRVPSISNAAIRIESGLVKLAVASEHRSLTVGLFAPNDTICAPPPRSISTTTSTTGLFSCSAMAARSLPA